MDNSINALQALLTEPWRNGSCLGYAIKAMENLDFSPDKIEHVTKEMKWLMDIMSTSEANTHYCSSRY